MADITLAVDTARPTGSRASGRLRAAGRIPAVIYGHGIEPVAVSVDAKELRHALGGEAGSRALLRLVLGENGAEGEHLAMARQLERHPVRQTVTHIDFQVVRRDEVITADIPVVLVGESQAVRQADGTIDLEAQTLSIKAKPADLPTNLEVDISNIQIGDAIRAGDLELPAGVELDVDADTPIVVAHAPHVAVLEEAPEATEEEAAESEASEES